MPISEQAFHDALNRGVPDRHLNTAAGESVLAGGAVYVRINHAHYRIDHAAALSHADCLRLAAGTVRWPSEAPGR